MSKIEVSEGVHLHVDDTGGDGRPVVLIHGWPLSAESWSAQVPALRDAGYRVVAYDRRGFGRSDKPESGFDYDTLTADLEAVVRELDLRDMTLVGFSMGGGEVARYVGRNGADRLRSVVFAAAIPPALGKSDDNPDGALPPEVHQQLQDGLTADHDGFIDGFMTGFFSVGDELKVSEEQRQAAVAIGQQSGETAALECMKAWTTDFRDDVAKITVPTLVIHGDSDATVPVEASGQRVADSVDGAEIEIVADAPHGLNTSHAEQFNAALLRFLER